MKPAVFLDRDGTLIEEKHYLHRPEEVVLFPDADVSLKRLSENGFELFLVTNQSGVGRGFYTLDDVKKVHSRLLDLLRPEGVAFREIYVAPETPDQAVYGRKPSPRFLLDARDQYQIDLGQSYMIGDKEVDVQCGWNAGVRQCMLVRTGYGKEHEGRLNGQLHRVQVVDDLAEAANWILTNHK